MRDQGKLVGLIRGFLIGEKGFLLGDLVVHASYQRQGIGTDLLRRIQNQYQDRKIFLEAKPNTVAFYEQRGFQRVRDSIFGKVPMKF